MVLYMESLCKAMISLHKNEGAQAAIPGVRAFVRIQFAESLTEQIFEELGFKVLGFWNSKGSKAFYFQDFWLLGFLSRFPGSELLGFQSAEVNSLNFATPLKPL